MQPTTNSLPRANFTFHPLSNPLMKSLSHLSKPARRSLFHLTLLSKILSLRGSPGTQDRNLKAETASEMVRKECCFLACSACLLYGPGPTTFPDMEGEHFQSELYPPTSILNQENARPTTDSPTGQSGGGILSTEVPLPR